MMFRVGVLVASDSCAAKTATDQSGLNLKDIIDKQNNFRTQVYDIVSDNQDEIKGKLIDWSDRLGLDLILTTGGTGFAPSDVTPEATKEVIHKEASSLTNMILIESMKITKFAALSRGLAGVRNHTLIINLPGSKKGSQESLEIVLPVLKHALDLIRNSREDVKKDHKIIQGTTSACGHHHQHDGNTKSRITNKDIIDRPRKSSYPMISVESAIEIILSNTEMMLHEEVHYMDSLNRVCADDILARDPLPPFAASVKDGFAVKLTREQNGYIKNMHTNDVKWVFRVVGASNAGDNLINMDLNEGECVKINTGAPVPLKADAVIQIEDTIAVEKDPSTGLDTVIEVVATTGCGGDGNNSRIDVKIGQDIRPVGFDIEPGQVVVNRGMIMKPAQIGICATVGALRVKVYKQPRVGLISTGNELCNPDEQETLGAGKIRDSNKSLLHSALKSFGLKDVIDAGIATDDCESVLKIFREALRTCDVIISTGGVSMGDKDLVKDVIEKDLNCKIHFARMNMKPGKPTTFATGEVDGKKKLIFCLPGNPVSAIVTFNLVVVPCLKKITGYKTTSFREIKVKCQFDAELDPRPEYHRCLLEWPDINGSDFLPNAFSTGNQHSSRLLSMNEANCLVKLPARNMDKKSVKKGEILSALLIENI